MLEEVMLLGTSTTTLQRHFFLKNKSLKCNIFRIVIEKLGFNVRVIYLGKIFEKLSVKV